MLVDNEPSGAVFTDERTHRLYLWRRWSREDSWVMFIGINPSTADERLNDPTVRRCMGFAASWGYGGMFMCNLFSLVSPYPSVLNTENNLERGTDLAMRVIRERCKIAVAAWGALIVKVKDGEDRVNRVEQNLSPLFCFGLTSKGYPRHPLYLPKDTQLVEYLRRKDIRSVK